MKARTPFASILKSFSSGAVHEFVTKVDFLPCVTAFAELVHKSRYHCEPTMRVGRGGKASWILKVSPKKGCFFCFESEKTNFTTFAPPLEKFWKNTLVAPLGKNPSDAQEPHTIESEMDLNYQQLHSRFSH